jgi:hypothetical protein
LCDPTRPEALVEILALVFAEVDLVVVFRGFGSFVVFFRAMVCRLLIA